MREVLTEVANNLNDARPAPVSKAALRATGPLEAPGETKKNIPAGHYYGMKDDGTIGHVPLRRTGGRRKRRTRRRKTSRRRKYEYGRRSDGKCRKTKKEDQEEVDVY